MARWIAPSVARTTGSASTTTPVTVAATPPRAAPTPHALHLLLRRARIAGPYVIAGHSLGGAFALRYTHRYPAEVAGVVLLDSMHPQQTDVFAGMDPLLALVSTLARTGLGRLLFDPKDGEPVA